MTFALEFGAAWIAIAVPAALFVGRFLRAGRGCDGLR